MNQQLTDYVSQARGQGMNDEQIRSELLNSGWQAGDVNQALGIETTPTKNFFLGKVGYIIVSAVLLLGIGVFAFSQLGFFDPSNEISQSSPTPAIDTPVPSPTDSPVPSANTRSTPTPKLSVSGTPKPTPTKTPQSNIPLEIVQATLNTSQLTYPFSGVTLNVVLRNNTSQQIDNYEYRFYLDEKTTFAQLVGNDLAYIEAGKTYVMEDAQSAITQLAKSCDFFGLATGQYHLHLKISTDTTKPLNSDTTGPTVTDKLIPFTLTSACQKK